ERCQRPGLSATPVVATEFWAPFAERTLRNTGCQFGSLRLDVRELHHLAPLFGFLGDQLGEVSGRTRKHRAAEVSEPRLHRGIGESHIDLLVECVDDLGGRVPGCAEAAHALASKPGTNSATVGMSGSAFARRNRRRGSSKLHQATASQIAGGYRN